jgi:hypothetical protein
VRARRYISSLRCKLATLTFRTGRIVGFNYEKKGANARNGATIFSNLIGKLDAVQVTCERCGRAGRQPAVRSLGATAVLVLGSPPVLQVLRQEH